MLCGTFLIFSYYSYGIINKIIYPEIIKRFIYYIVIILECCITFNKLKYRLGSMGKILNSKVTGDGKIVFEISVDYDEALQLKGHVKNVHLFSEDVSDIKSNISLRGKNEATKYFLIPKEIRKDLKFNTKVTCQKIEADTKTIFIYLVDKFRLD